VVPLAGDQALVADTPDVRLVVRPPLREDADARPALYLGRDDGGRAYLALSGPPRPVDDTAGADGRHGARWAGLREVGALLDDTDAGILTTAVALVHWHATHERCARCGEPTDVVNAGWSRRCPACGAEHFPRTDPAVIMSVVDVDDRLLLGRQAVWPERRFSTLAGFVEPGESLEAAVRREVREESGVQVGTVAYRGSQPWPFPSSLMVGFRADATTTQVTVDGEEITQARWWTRTELAEDVAAREVLLPPPVSIARRLIEDWYGAPVEDAGEAWR
jgi:NAD+ diphosphatase